MKWQQFVPLILVIVAAVLLVWRGSSKKTRGCGCKCGCAHGPDAGPKQEDAGR
jgi:hypothetical protein